MPDHVTVNCARKGCYAIITMHPDDEARLRRTHESFYCPAGHGSHFPGKTPEQKEIDELQRRVEVTERCVDEWRERWESQHAAAAALTHGAQVCPLGCGWTTRRRLPWNPSVSDVDRFLDRVGSDLVEHLLADHNATRKPVALLTEHATTHGSAA
jgi:hypothetical protein